MSRVVRKKSPNGITIGMASVILMGMGIALILTFVKIYLSNQIYKESKEINSIQRRVDALKAEKMILADNVEKLKFKNQVEDTIFTISETDE
jgi:cell division protein FtsL